MTIMPKLTTLCVAFLFSIGSINSIDYQCPFSSSCNTKIINEKIYSECEIVCDGKEFPCSRISIFDS